MNGGNTFVFNFETTYESDWAVTCPVKDVNDLDDVLQSTNPLKGSTSGNVITGVNGGSGAADILSADEDTELTDIAFGSNSQSFGVNDSVLAHPQAVPGPRAGAGCAEMYNVSTLRSWSL